MCVERESLWRVEDWDTWTVLISDVRRARRGGWFWYLDSFNLLLDTQRLH